jgi:hypothetical protein
LERGMQAKNGSQQGPYLVVASEPDIDYWCT